MASDLEEIFPRLTAGNYQITSSQDPGYNCTAWAIGDTQRWWWPEDDPIDGHWPEGVDRKTTLPAFVAAFACWGYAPCDNEGVEAGWEKVALFSGGDGLVTHAARQLPNGRWTSKLGKMVDIEHALRDLEGDAYGTVVLILRRAQPSAES